MTSTAPDLETRVEQSLLRVFRDAFIDVDFASYAEPGERTGKCLGVKSESGAEDPIGTNMFPVSIEIEAVNFDEAERQLLHEMIGNAHNAKETISAYSAKQFAMPRGQAVEMLGAPRTVANQNERIITYNLIATIQPL